MESVTDPERRGSLDLLRRGEASALAVAALTIFAIGWVSIWATKPAGDISLLWPCNAVAIALMVRWPTRRRALLLGAFLALVAVNFAFRSPIALAILLPLIDLVEIGIVTAVVTGGTALPRTMGGFGRLVGVAVLATLVSAGLASVAIGLVTGAPIWVTSYHWFASNLMGLLVALPVLLSIDYVDLAKLRRRDDAIAVVTVAGVTVFIALLVFYFAREPLLFLLMPCGIFAAFRLRFVGASLSIAIMGVIATLCTVHGFGPIASRYDQAADRILFLQAFISVATLTVFPMAILLNEMSRAFRVVREAKRQLQLLTENSNDIIVRVALDGRRLYVSPASQRVLGYSPEELLDRLPATDIHPDDRDRVRAVARTLLDGAIDPICAYRQLNRDGKYVWLEATYRLVTVNGEPTEFVASIRDITSRRAAEQAATLALATIEERERLLSMAGKIARLGIWRLDRQARTVDWSPEVYQIYGVPDSFEPTIGNALSYYHPDDAPRVETLVVKAFDSGESFNFEARVVQPSGAIRWVASSGQAELGANGEVTGLFGVLHDITERVETLRAVIRAREEAERALDAKAQFAATIAHEIRTPLTSMLGTASLLRTSEDEAVRKRHLDTLERSGQLLSSIVDDVLTYSKLEEGKSPPEAFEFDLRDILDDIVAVFANDAASKGLSIAMRGLEEPAGVIGDPARLSRVLINLVSNALKFTTQGGIAITVRRPVDDDIWRFDVEDTGVGIPADRVEAIFEPFVQAEASTTRSFGGTGLGLSISRLLLESMGGEISVQTGLYRGSCFRFSLPLPAARLSAVRDAGRSVPSASGRKRILLAEDNEVNRYLIAELIGQLGHEVITVENGERAVEVITRGKGAAIDLVLMDVHMPVMDGIAAAEAIRDFEGLGDELPIFALTADASIERRMAIFDARMNGVLAKPVDLEALRAAIDGRFSHEKPHVPPSGYASSMPIDPERIDGLEATLGREARNVLLSLLIDNASQAPKRIRDLLEADQPDLARLEAHSLRGAAASVGAYVLVDILMQIEHAGDQDVSEALLLKLDAAVEDVVSSARAASTGSSDTVPSFASSI